MAGSGKATLGPTGALALPLASVTPPHQDISSSGDSTQINNSCTIAMVVLVTCSLSSNLCESTKI